MYLSTPAIRPQTSTDAPTDRQTARRRRDVDSLEIAAMSARRAVACASVPQSMPSKNLQVDAGIAQRQLTATLPRRTSSFVGRDDNPALPALRGSTAVAVRVVPVNGSKEAVPLEPEIWPQTMRDSGKLIRAMQARRVLCGADGVRTPVSLPCGVAPAWGSGANRMGGLSLLSGGASVLDWIRAHPWPTLGMAGAVVLGLGYRGSK